MRPTRRRRRSSCRTCCPGEQGARWDPDLAGALSGLHLGHGAGDLARGLRNGIVAESRHCLAVARRRPAEARS